MCHEGQNRNRLESRQCRRFPGSWCLTLPADDLLSRAVSPHPSNNQTYLRYSEFNHNQRDFQHLGITRKWALTEKPLSFVTLTMKTLDFHRTCAGAPLERCGLFPISTRNGMPWCSRERWRRKVQCSVSRSPFFLTIPPILTLISTDSDTVTLVRILTNRSNAQRQALAKTFEEITQKVINLAP